jgi:hypothetical protein
MTKGQTMIPKGLHRKQIIDQYEAHNNTEDELRYSEG